jgi:phage terminase large subunit-like protein
VAVATRPTRANASSRRTIPPCDQYGCAQVGDHFCRPRAQRAVRFFAEVLVHTKGRWARHPFVLSEWQRKGIVEPMFGTVEWSVENQRYLRRFRTAWIELARRNGKSELMAGIALALLVADDEEGAEIYGAALDVEQAGRVFRVAERMVKLSDLLSRRLRVYANERIVDEQMGSFYTVVAGDAAGNLGQNPHGILFDEILTQRDRDLWDALRTGFGNRLQPLMVAATTAGNDPTGFCAAEHDYSIRCEQDPSFDPRRLVFIRNTPADADPWDERNWRHANPALGDFLSLDTLRDEALEARNDPAKENAFRQFRLNQWVQQSTRWMPLHLWDQCAAPQLPPWELDKLAEGHLCFGGLDLSSKFDLTALAWVFPDLGNLALWRFWVPEETVPLLTRLTGGQFAVWIRQGWVRVCPGGVIDYDELYRQLGEDSRRYRVEEVGFDPWMAVSAHAELSKLGISSFAVTQGVGLSEPMNELMRLVKLEQFHHGGNPVARWNADCLEVRQDMRERIYPVKPKRHVSGKRIDGIAAVVMAIDGLVRRQGSHARTQVAAF